MEKLKSMFFLLSALVLAVAPFAYAGQESGMKPGYHHKGEYGTGYHHWNTGARTESKRADQILGKSVVAEDETELGTLQDLVIFGRGVVHYGILALAGEDGRYVAIPFSFLESRGEEDSLVLHMDSEKVRGAPKFSLEEITDWDNSEIGERVHDYYGMETRQGMGMDMMRGHPDYPRGQKTLPGTGKAPEPGMRGQ